MFIQERGHLAELDIKYFSKDPKWEQLQILFANCWLNNVLMKENIFKILNGVKLASLYLEVDELGKGLKKFS
mgnify:CR=1 FL=1